MKFCSEIASGTRVNKTVSHDLKKSCWRRILMEHGLHLRAFFIYHFSNFAGETVSMYASLPWTFQSTRSWKILRKTARTRSFVISCAHALAMSCASIYQFLRLMGWCIKESCKRLRSNCRCLDRDLEGEVFVLTCFVSEPAEKCTKRKRREMPLFPNNGKLFSDQTMRIYTNSNNMLKYEQRKCLICAEIGSKLLLFFLGWPLETFPTHGISPVGVILHPTL